MNKKLSPLATFHLTGEGPRSDPGDMGRMGLSPALFSAYRDLPKLRYDFPLVLVAGDADGSFVHTLSGIIDGILQEIAPRGIGGERLRKNVLELEEEIRTLVSRGSEGSLLQLWDTAETNLLSIAGDAGRKTLSDSLSHARAVLRFDGEVIDFDGEMPAKLLTHAWTVAHEAKARKFFDRVNELALKLSDILKADSMKSGDARSAEALKRSVGSAYEAVFDFEAMSGLLGTAAKDGVMPEKQRRRILSALSALESQRFFAPPKRHGKKRRRKDSHIFVFDRCTRALEAFQERLPEMIELIKAMSIAELEIENRYRESAHDPFFRRFDERSLEPDDLLLFPSYLVCLGERLDDMAERATLMEVLSSGLPIKVVVQNDDILEELSISTGRLSFGIRGTQLAAAALGFNNAFVLQTSGCGLYRQREPILRRLAGNGPALFSIFSGLAGTASGSAKNAPDVPPYLRAAAAQESRAFPTFVYDPALGSDWESRFSVGGNPQAEADWPIHHFCYEDEDLQKISEDIAFTFVDFVAADGRFAENFSTVPRSKWHDGMVPVNAFLDLETGAQAEKTPYILMVDENNVLHRVIVDDKLVQAARRCREMWRNLQELGGINNSHATKLLAKEKEIWVEEKERELAALKARPELETEETAPPVPAEAKEMEEAMPEIAEAPEIPAGEPYIETPRCTTCNECTDINNKMFVYDDNDQAYIADPDAGTFRQLVEATESCQVAIIHPGRPRNPKEPDLDDLISRADPFN